MKLSLTARWLFALGRLEGISFLSLLAIGMPLKYAAHMPEPNAWIGWCHGFLFLVYLVALSSARRVENWPRTWLLWGGLGSVVPAGTFVFEAMLRKRLR